MPLLPDWLLPGRRLAAPETKDSRTASVIALTTGGRPVWTPRDYASLTREGFAQNVIAYRCVRLVAEAAASVPLVAFEGGERAADHPLQALLDRPNPEQGRADLMESFFGALQTSGNAYLEAAGDESQPSELYALRPDRMRVVPGPRGWPEAYDYEAGGRSVRIAREADGFLPVLHLKLLNPLDDHYGFSPLQAAAYSVDVHNASAGWNKALLDNAARPSGALVYAPKEGGERLTQDQFDRLKDELTSAHVGGANAGRPLLLEGGLDWKPISLTPAEMDFIEGKNAAAREIALAFGVPAQLLGIPGDNTYSNYREANAAFWRQTVVPLAERAARAVSAWLGPRFGGASLRCDLDAVPALSAERDALWARLEAATFLTPEERRRMAGVSHE
ncbi:MAG: phage portal protein [Caulobacteraceae bacterium]